MEQHIVDCVTTHAVCHNAMEIATVRFRVRGRVREVRVKVRVTSMVGGFG